MKLKTLLAVLAVVLALNEVSAQNFKFRKVSKEEVLEKEHPLEKEAEAAYLYNYRYTYYGILADGINLTTEIHQRIKIYSDEGFAYAEFEIPLYEGRDAEEALVGLKAYTYNLEDGKVEEYKLDKDDIFKEEVSEYRKKVSFTMPKVKEGSVIEISYRINSSYYFNVDTFQFQHGIPVNRLEAKFSAPENFTFKMRNKGYYYINAAVSKRHNPQIGSQDVLYTYEENNIPSLKAEAYVDNINNYRSGVNFELAQIDIPGSFFKSYAQSWEDVTKFIYDSGLETELNKEGYFKDDLDPVLQKYTGQSERIAAVFDFVRSRMNWDESYGYNGRYGVRKAYKESTGNVADINMMLVAMLRYAGMVANPVLVSTKSHGLPLFPTSDGFNYLIAAVELEGRVVLLDATSKLATPNILPYRALNWEGRLIREDGSSVPVDLSAAVKGESAVNLSVMLNEDGSIDGRLRKQLTNHRAYGFRNSHVNMIEEEYLEELENDLAGIEIENYAVDNLKNPYKPLVENFEFHKEQGVEEISGKIFLSPMMFFSMKENPFTSESRVYPVDFIYPNSNSYQINFMLPEGYQVESLPESTKFVMPDNVASFLYQVASRGNIVQLKVTTDINVDILPSDYYEYLKAFYSEIIKKEAEKIVITKV